MKKNSQRGITLIELLIVISIIGIMAYSAAPNLSNVMSHKDLNTARSTLLLSLNKAKNIARTQSTIVEVSISENIITLAPGNASADESIKMPDTVSPTTSVSNFRFNSMGMATTPEDANIDADMTITIQPSTNEDISSTITITPTGLIAASAAS